MPLGRLGYRIHRLHIVGDAQLPIRQCLLELPGVVRKELLARVVSHPQMFGQCELTLNTV